MLSQLTDRIDQAIDSTGRIVAGITADQWELHTPCAGWDVRTLLNHIVGGMRIFTAERTATSAGADHHADWLGADPSASAPASTN